jgi:uncharacterized membrane protein YccF (DUF307 family)
MRTIGNVLWLVFGGIFMALGYAVAGLIAFVFIITIPFGLAAFRLASFTLWPFGRTLIKNPSAGAPSTIGNILWVLLFGWWLALGHLVSAVLLAISIIGIPFAVVHVKLAATSLWPLGTMIVPISSLAPSQVGIVVGGSEPPST